jgi:hypothetical protein
VLALGTFPTAPHQTVHAGFPAHSFSAVNSNYSATIIAPVRDLLVTWMANDQCFASSSKHKLNPDRLTLFALPSPMQVSELSYVMGF